MKFGEYDVEIARRHRFLSLKSVSRFRNVYPRTAETSHHVTFALVRPFPEQILISSTNKAMEMLE